MLLALRPAHLGNVHKTFNARIEFHESAIIGHTDDTSLHANAHREPLGDLRPWIRQQLAAPQGHAHFFAVKLEHLYVHLVPTPNHVNLITDAAPRKIRYLQETIDAAHIHT